MGRFRGGLHGSKKAGPSGEGRRWPARQVVGTLWIVDDDATRALMTSFYAALRGGEGRAPRRVSAALALARAEVRAQARWAHPHFWAAWVVWGRDPSE